MESEFVIVIDTREKQPWQFKCASETTKLDTGDYSIKGLESLLCLERKKSVSEIAGNITKPAFNNELQRMLSYKHRFILFEFDVDDVLTYPIGSNIPKRMWDKIKTTGKYIMRFISEIQTKYNIHTLFCGDTENAEYVAYNIMKRIYEQNQS